jgi:hypothetical protein
MNPDPEQDLKRFRLSPPAPELRAQVLAAARREWSRPSLPRTWPSSQRPLLAIAASILIVAGSHWLNALLVIPAEAWPPRAAVSAVDAESIFADLPAALALYEIPPAADSRALVIVLETRRTQLQLLRELIPEPPVPSFPGPLSRQFRQIPPWQSSWS